MIVIRNFVSPLPSADDKKTCSCGYTKNAWKSHLLPVPRSEAFALPITVRTSNAEAPRRIC